MATGIKIYNDANTIQIDETYRNVCLVEKRSIGVSNSFGISYTNVSVTGPRALVCMESANYAPLLANVTFDGTSWVWRWGFAYLGGSYPTSDTVTAWIFDYLVSPPSDTIGLKVFNASGEMVYHSAAKPLRIAATQAHNSNYTGTSGRKYVPLVMASAYYTETVGFSTTGYTIGLQSSSNTITGQPFALGGGVATTARYGQYAAVDVTHY